MNEEMDAEAALSQLPAEVPNRAAAEQGKPLSQCRVPASRQENPAKCRAGIFGSLGKRPVQSAIIMML